MHAFIRLFCVLMCLSLFSSPVLAASTFGFTVKADSANSIVAPGAKWRIHPHLALEGFYFGGWTDYDGYAVRAMAISAPWPSLSFPVRGYAGIGYARLEQEVYRNTFTFRSPTAETIVQPELSATARGEGIQLFAGIEWIPLVNVQRFRIECEIGYALFDVEGRGRLIVENATASPVVIGTNVVSDYEKLTAVLAASWYFF